MEQYISKSALVAEIQRLQDLTMDENKNFYSEAAEGEYNALCNIEHFIDSLQEESVSVWHDASELPDETSLLLLLLKDGNFIVADEKTAYIRELVDKWCYVSDI